MDTPTRPVSPLRQRMLDDMRMRKLTPKTQSAYRGSTLHPDFRPFWESASSAGAGLTAAIAKALWWHVCNRKPQA